MAVVPTSQSFHETMDGNEITAIYKFDWIEWNANTANIPHIGDSWSDSKLDMRCVDVDAQETESPSIGMATCLFSNVLAQENAQNRADQLKSWSERLSFSTQTDGGDYIWTANAGTPSWASFVEHWKTYGPTITGVTRSDDNAPELNNEIKIGILNIRTFGSTSLLIRSMNYVNATNSVNFLKKYILRVQTVREDFKDDVLSSALWVDAGRWKIADVRTRAMNASTWIYNWTFEYNPSIMWNFPHGVSATTNQFVELDLMDAFEGMDFNVPEGFPEYNG